MFFRSYPIENIIHQSIIKINEFTSLCVIHDYCVVQLAHIILTNQANEK